MKKKQKFVLSMLIGLSILGIAACSKSGDQSQREDNTTLTLYSWDTKTVMQPALDAFQDKYPDVTIEFSNKPPVDEYVQGLQTKLLSKTAADVFVMGAENKTNLITSGNVADLSEFSFMDNLNETNKNLYSSEGKVYSASISSWGGGIAYNKEILKEIGVEEFPTTWEEFIELCLKLKESGINPYYEGGQSGNFMSLSALIGSNYARRGGIRDEEIFDGTTTFSSEYIEALEMWNELNEKEIFTQDILGLSDDQIINEFINGNVAMVCMGPWNVSTVRTSNPDLDFEIAPVPGKEVGDEYAAGAPSPGYSINANAKNPELAAKFVEFMTTPEAAVALNGDGSSNNMYTIEGTENVNSTLDSSLLSINQVVQDGKIYLAQMTWPAYQDILTTHFRSQLQELIQGKTTPEDVLKSMDDKLSELMK
ncbi:ABC transporter substrate-binding protein [Streptococcus moroccensis]|uniref:Raffinose/stachyose/melibiose transport system substrate-binding protein n=1 Tax=Streptococcus moroccensis TaxID=1451356 RepID=A0ABT9YS27_9STRE|nr:sugar ABC transporter substrate-binding protein [Streptococcus moroccensis]MDQ0222411.1 raffinose/stachyose/melibiose transport system substrate-binding protein [Streptococcus moroccensis]